MKQLLLVDLLLRQECVDDQVVVRLDLLVVRQENSEQRNQSVLCATLINDQLHGVDKFLRELVTHCIDTLIVENVHEQNQCIAGQVLQICLL